MLTNRIRKEIEWHFYNYQADLSLYNAKVEDIVYGGLTARYDRVGGGGGEPSSPTESKAFKLEYLDREKNWATVVRNTFTVFRFEPEYDIMVELYIKRRSRKELLSDGLWETTFFRWREKWLMCAYKWAREFRLL